MEALKLAWSVDEIIAMRGSKVVRLNLRESQPDDEAVAALIIGPTGNLRAPAIRCGRRLLVGFNETAYTTVLK